MRLDNVREDIRRWGLTKTLYMRVMWRLEKYLGFRLFVVHSRVLNANAPEVDVPDGSSARMLERDELVAFSRDPSLGFSESFVAQAYARGDVCFGYLDGGTLVAYTWIGTQPMPTAPGLWVRFGDGYSYSYKALTLPSHRGRHLQECLVHRSERWRMAQGSRYNIGYIDTTNFASIVADRRYGNRAVGYAGYCSWFGRAIPFRSPGVKACGFGFFSPPADEQGATIRNHAASVDSTSRR